VRLHDFPDSGNGYKVRLLLAQLGRACEYVPVDILAGESRRPAFRARNPNGRIPVLELDDGQLLWESNAILFHLAEGTPFLPGPGLDRARVLQWMFFEQYSHEPHIATSRFWRRHAELTPWHHERLAEKRTAGEAALAVMEGHLAQRAFFVADRYGIADVALYAYTHVAPEGGFSLDPYPAVRDWLARVEARPGFVPLAASLAEGGGGRLSGAPVVD
jgi:glutathione S-transferase